MAYAYPIALAVVSAAVMLAERLFPLRRQAQVRATFGSDLLHLVFNGHFLGVIVFGIASAYVLPTFDGWLEAAGCEAVRRVETGPFSAMVVGRKPAG